MWLHLLVAAHHAAGVVHQPADAARPRCTPAEITDTDDAGCGKLFPRFHPKNTAPLAHNNDANAPFFFRGKYHIFMQADFPGVQDWNGAIGIAHLSSPDGATWTALPPAMLPGRWGGPPSTVGNPGGNATGGYYSGSAAVVDGVPRLVVPAVFGHDANTSLVQCVGGRAGWYSMHSGCHMSYVFTEPADLSDPDLKEWKEPVTIIDGRTDGVQPHGPGLDDNTHAFPDPTTPGRWLFVGQTTVCQTASCHDLSKGDRPEYLQVWGSKAGSDWTQGFKSLGDLGASLPTLRTSGAALPVRAIMNCPVLGSLDSEIPSDPRLHAWPNASMAFLAFGSNSYFMGRMRYASAQVGGIGFVPYVRASSQNDYYVRCCTRARLSSLHLLVA